VTEKREQGAAVSSLVSKSKRAVSLFHFFSRAVLRDQNPLLSQQPFLGDGLQGLADPIFFVGWVKENEVKGFSSPSQKPYGSEDRGCPYLRPAGKTQRLEVFTDRLSCPVRRIYQRGLRSTPTQRLRGQASRAGKKIQDSVSGKIVGEDVEKRLFDPIGSRTQRPAPGGFQAPPLRLSSNHAHFKLSAIGDQLSAGHSVGLKTGLFVYLQDDLAELLSLL